MNQKKLLTAWACLFVLCAAFGFIPNPQGFARGMLMLAAVGFFVPPGLLIYRAVNRKTPDRNTLRFVRNLSLWSLGITTAVLLLNFASALWPEAVGVALYALLVILSSPMICGQYWFIGLFGWACLLMVCLKYLRKK